MYKVLQLEA